MRPRLLKASGCVCTNASCGPNGIVSRAGWRMGRTERLSIPKERSYTGLSHPKLENPRAYNFVGNFTASPWKLLTACGVNLRHEVVVGLCV